MSDRKETDNQGKERMSDMKDSQGEREDRP